MYEALVRIYKKTKDSNLLSNAVKEGWITEPKMQQIIDKNK